MPEGTEAEVAADVLARIAVERVDGLFGGQEPFTLFRSAVYTSLGDADAETFETLAQRANVRVANADR